MSGGDTLGKYLGKVFSMRSLAAGAMAAGATTILGGEGFSLSSFGEQVLLVGLPTVAATDVANLVEPYTGGEKITATSSLVRMATAGAVADGILMFTGQLESGFSLEGLTVFAISAAAVTLADRLVPAGPV